jgi:glycosyltransferase involved in cell wall biosynthesis
MSEVQEIVQKHKDAVHIMGGIRVGAMLSAAFDACVQCGCKLGIMTEPYNDAGMKGFLRTLKYRYYKIKYFKHIQFVLAIGRQGVAQYGALGFNKARIFPWAYFLTVPTEGRRSSDSQMQRIIYAGRLEAAKGIHRFLSELVESGKGNYTFDVYGTGEDEAKMKQHVVERGLAESIRFYPFLKYDELLKQYANYDWVVLPSAGKDGWGVIVSEGLLNGLKAICSDICGVSRVVRDGVNGKVFSWSEAGSCQKAINEMLVGKEFAQPEAIAAWANKGISAEAGAAYFMRIIDSVYNGTVKPGMPWEEAGI